MSSPSEAAGGKGGGKKGRQQRNSGLGRGDGTKQPPAGSGGNVRSVFKGDTPEMNGNVFQCFHESNKPNQFKKTLEALSSYISKTLKSAGDLKGLIKDLVQPTITAPQKLATADEYDKIIWAEEYKLYTKSAKVLKDNLEAVFAVIWGQCSEQLRSKIKEQASYERSQELSECGWLLKEIKGSMSGFESKRYKATQLCMALNSVMSHRQGSDQTVAKYVESFIEKVEILEYFITGLCNPFVTLVAKNHGNTKKSRDQWLGAQLMIGADPRRFGALQANLHNQFEQGVDKNPKTIQAAYSRLNSYMAEVSVKAPTSSNTSTPAAVTAVAKAVVPTETKDIAPATPPGLTFAQLAKTPIAGTDGKTHTSVECYKCHTRGHYSAQCPKPTTPTAIATQLMQVSPPGHTDVDTDGSTTPAIMFATMNTTLDSGSIPASWLVLDTASTVSIFANEHYLTNIRSSDTTLEVLTNGGLMESSLIGDVSGLGSVWYNPASMANILSFAQVQKMCRITVDTDLEPAISVHRSTGTIVKFLEFGNGLYYFDAAAQNLSPPLACNPVPGYTFLQTVSGNKARFHRREIEGADRAVELLRKLKRLSQADFERILRNNLIRNCPVTVDDARRAVLIYGTDRATLQGKTVKNHGANVAVPTFIPTELPPLMLHDHRQVTLAVDFFYVQGLAFLHTISCKLKFRTITQVANRSRATIKSEVSRILEIYKARGFDVVDLHADMEFKCVEYDFLPCE